MIINEEKQNREDLLRLMQENPDLPIVPMIDGKIVTSNDNYYWQGRIREVCIETCVYGDKRIHFYDDNCSFKRIMEVLMDGFEDPIICKSLDEEELAYEYDALPWTNAIVVYIGCPKKNMEKLRLIKKLNVITLTERKF